MPYILWGCFEIGDFFKYLRILYDVLSFACIKGEVSMARGNLVSGLPKHHQSDVNLYLFPNMENKKDSQGLSERERER